MAVEEVVQLLLHQEEEEAVQQEPVVMALHQVALAAQPCLLELQVQQAQAQMKLTIEEHLAAVLLRLLTQVVLVFMVEVEVGLAKQVTLTV